MKYEEALLSPEISWDEMTAGIKIPKSLFKYQSFYMQDGMENPYWERNMKGEFHLSVGKEFEDKNDCKPFINKEIVSQFIENFFTSMSIERKQIDTIMKGLDSAITETYMNSIVDNYQDKIRIGCFTDLSDNMAMWEKYANLKRGYCIEYDTSKNVLFDVSTLPIWYTSKPFDSSLSLARHLILKSTKKGKKQSEEEHFDIYKSIYEKEDKMVYIPIFIKQKKVWGFEREYRLFLLEQRTTRMGNIKRNEYLDKHANLDLSQALKAIYIGECFEENPNHEVLLKKVCLLAESKKIPLYRKEKGNGCYKNILIL